MSDAYAEQVKEGPPAPAPVDGCSITLTITLHPNKQIDFSFPTHELLAYGLLEKARAKLDELALVREAQRQQQVAAASHGINGLVKRLKGGR